MAIADYHGRKIDLLALRGATAQGASVLQQSLFDSASSGEVCTGVQKLLQRWVLEFMTIRGSMPFLPERGSGFIAAARRGTMRTEADALVEFRFAAEEVRQNLVAEESADMPADERFAEAILDQLILTEDSGLAVSVTITSRAGNARKAILPIGASPLLAEI